MPRGLVIPFSADLRQWGKAIRNIGRDLDDVVDDFKDVERGSDRAFDDIERNAEDAADDIERAFAGLGRDVENEFDRMERAARDVDLDVAEGVDSAAGSAKQAAGLLAGEVVDEFVENWGEAVRSGDYASALRETLSQLGQIGGIFGPAGAAIGGGLALAATTAFDAFMNTEGKQRIAEATAGIFDATESAELSGAEAAAAYARGFVEKGDIGNQVQQALGTESVADAWLEVGRIASETGLSQEVVTEALLGQRGALEAVQGALANNQAAYDANRDAAGEVFGKDQARFLELERQKGVLNDQQGALGNLLGLTNEQLTANRQAAEADRIRRDTVAGVNSELGEGSRILSNLPDPNLGNLVSSTALSAQNAQAARDAINSIPTQKTIRVDVNTFGGAYVGKRLPI